MSGGLFARRARTLVGLLRAAPAVSRSDHPTRRARNEATVVLGQSRLLRRLGPGLAHAFIFWGFLILLPTIVIAMIGVVDKHATLPWLGHQGWYELLVDIFAVLVLVGVLAALWIRKVVRPRRFEGSHLGEADVILALIATIATTLLLWHATRIALGLNEWPRAWSPVSYALSHLFVRNQATRVLERVFVWAHVLTILAFLAYLPRSKHLHILAAAVNVWFGRTGAGGRLEPLDFERDDAEIRFGSGRAADLNFKEVLDTFSCTECGRCQDACPAFATDKVLSPKLVIMGLRDHVLAREDAALVPDAVPEESVWDCVTCGACVEVVPGLDRARRPDRGPPPPPGDGRLELPRRGGAHAARRRTCLQPMGEGPVRAGRLGLRARCAGARARAIPHPNTSTGWGVHRRSMSAPDGRRVDRQAAEVGRNRFRDPRAARELYRGPGSPDRQRVPLPGASPSRTSAP